MDRPSHLQAAVVRADGEVALPDDRTALVLQHPPYDGRLALASEPLREALASSGAAVVLLLPGGADPTAELLVAATACHPDAQVLATPRPVVDAIKRVDGDQLAATVEREGLRWATSPAAVDRTHLDALLAASPDGGVSALTGPVGWLAAAGGT